jgi:hypothetical protein
MVKLMGEFLQHLAVTHKEVGTKFFPKLNFIFWFRFKVWFLYFAVLARRNLINDFDHLVQHKKLPGRHRWGLFTEETSTHCRKEKNFQLHENKTRR